MEKPGNHHIIQDNMQISENADHAYLHRDTEGFSREKAFAWLSVYLIASGFLSTVFALLVLVCTYYPTEILQNLSGLFALVAPIVLMGIGIVSVLPFSEYAYMRQAGINPAIARESIRHQKRGPEKREFGVLLGIVGITSLFKVSPWDFFFILVEPILGILVVALAMTAALASLTAFYKRRISGYVKLGAYQNHEFAEA